MNLRAMVLLWDKRSAISHWIDLHHRCRSVESLKRRLRRGAKQGHWTGWRIITINEEGGCDGEETDSPGRSPAAYCINARAGVDTERADGAAALWAGSACRYLSAFAALVRGPGEPALPMERGITMTTNTRYWLFGGATYYASGGMYDAMDRFGSLNDAIAHARAWENHQRDREWWHVVDTVTGELVAESDCRPYGAPERKANP